MKYYKSIALALVVLFSVTSFVSASSTTSTSSKDLQERRLKVEQKIKEVRATSTACTLLTGRIDKRLSNFDSVFKKHNENYNQHITKLQTISSKLQAEGKDVSKLNSDIAILQVKVDKFNTDKLAVQTGLGDTKQYSCGNSQGQFRGSVEAVRTAQTTVKADAMDISNFIKNVLRADILAFKK